MMELTWTAGGALTVEQLMNAAAGAGTQTAGLKFAGGRERFSTKQQLRNI